MLSVEKIRNDAKSNFANTISGTDLIVGARSGSIQLLLYSVFRIGNATNNISWKSYRSISKRKNIKWTIPISLGDSHRGFRVMGTNKTYFDHFRFGQKRKLQFQKGRSFEDVFETVLGIDVAQTLGYKLGDKIIIDHGIGADSFEKHNDKPFIVTGILKYTGTPVDRTVHIGLEGITAIHIDWRSGRRVIGLTTDPDTVKKIDLTPVSITAFLVGLKSRLAAFKVLRDINTFPREPLLAILPGVALQELWTLMDIAETALGGVTIMVVAASLLCMVTAVLSSLSERRREMAILRSLGARPLHVGLMFLIESILISVIGCFLGYLLYFFGIIILQPIIENHFGLFLPITLPTLRDWIIIAFVIAASAITGFVPALMAYRQSLVDGMTVKY